MLLGVTSENLLSVSTWSNIFKLLKVVVFQQLSTTIGITRSVRGFQALMFLVKDNKALRIIFSPSKTQSFANLRIVILNCHYIWRIIRRLMESSCSSSSRFKLIMMTRLS